jgi:hypothetical protein
MRFEQAEGTGLEPATPCGASDFESDSSPFGYPPDAMLPVSGDLLKARSRTNMSFLARGRMAAHAGEKLTACLPLRSPGGKSGGLAIDARGKAQWVRASAAQRF